MGQDDATDGHCHRANSKEPRCRDWVSRRFGHRPHRQVKHQIHRTQPEEGDVAEPIESALQAGVAAQPVRPLEAQTEDKPAGKPQQNPEPGQNQVEVRYCVHSIAPITAIR
jgi:hypothetical protein